MGILTNINVDEAVRNEALILDMANNISNRTTPYIYETDSANLRSGLGCGDKVFNANHIKIVGSTLFLKHPRMGIRGEFDYAKYGIRAINGKNIRFDFNTTGYPEIVCADEWIIDNNSVLAGHNIGAEVGTIRFLGHWYSGYAELVNCHLNVDQIIFENHIDRFRNVTGRIGWITMKCMDLWDIELLCKFLIPQELPGKSIKNMKDLRAYFNNPKKYNANVDVGQLFDCDKIIEIFGLNTVTGLYHLTFKDLNVQIDFVKPTDKWICSSIQKR